MTTASKYFYLTSDGGNSWSKDSLALDGSVIYGVSSVPGFDGGFVIAVGDTINYLVTVLFTPDFFNTIVAFDSNLNADPYGIKFKDATTGWLCAWGDGADTSAILKYTGILTSISNVAKSPESLTMIPNPTATEALIKLPRMNEKGDLTLVIYNAAGTMLENRRIESATGWTKQDASTYNNGVYILQIVSGDRLIASTKWVVQH